MKDAEIKQKYSWFERIILILLLMTPAVLIVGWVFSGIGVSAKNMEKDARTAHYIDKDWAVVSDINDQIGAMLFYDQERDGQLPADYTGSIYVKDDIGYRFRYGGSIMGNGREIIIFKIDDFGYVVAALNDSGFRKVMIIDQERQEEKIILEDTPFIFAVTEDAELIFYDAEGLANKVMKIKEEVSHSISDLLQP